MGKKRGFFAELQYQGQQAEKRRQQEARAAARAHATAVRSAEQARRRAERAAQSAATADKARRAAADKEAAALHVIARQAEAEVMTAELTERYSDIDGLLAATLAVDDFVDLQDLRVNAIEHPPFDAGRHGVPTPPPPVPVYPPEPRWETPSPPTGLGAAFGGKKRHEEEVARAWAAYQQALHSVHQSAQAVHAEHQRLSAKYEEAERARQAKVQHLKAKYQQECEERESSARDSNAELDRLINDLAFDVPWAIQEYIGIVLSNSVYPDAFPVEHDFRFDLDTRELQLTARVPPPSDIPTIKEYKHVRARDEITSTKLTLRDQKARYGSAVAQVAVRSLHEIFEADRSARIRTISLTVDTATINPGTGLPDVVPLVQVAADRDEFSRFDLANIVPEATLGHLGAGVSKSPFDLTPVDTAKSVRGRTQ